MVVLHRIILVGQSSQFVKVSGEQGERFYSAHTQAPLLKGVRVAEDRYIFFRRGCCTPSSSPFQLKLLMNSNGFSPTIFLF